MKTYTPKTLNSSVCDMAKHFDSLDDAFDITPVEEVKPIKRKSKPLIISDKEEDKERDYQYARGQLYNILDKLQETLDGAMEVAAESQHPRAYEVCFQGAKHAADVVEKLTDLQKKVKDLDKDETKIQTNTQNNVFLGSTEELMKMLKQQKDK